MRPIERYRWRALIHSVMLGRLGFDIDGRLAKEDLTHLRDGLPWLKQRNIVGVCIAPKRKDGVRKKDAELCLQILVRKKREKVAADRFIDKFIDARPVINRRRLLTDVVAIGDILPNSFISGARPTQPGFSVGGELTGIGTIGCAVRDAQDPTGPLLGLSCAHVVADNGRAAPGAEVLVPALAQAAALGIPNPEFGTLVRSGAIAFGNSGASANLDAATFAPQDPTWLEDEIADLNLAPAGVLVDLQGGEAVLKVGAATQTTRGVVESPHVGVKVPYVLGNSVKIAKFVDQISISPIGPDPFAIPGDSGSLVMTDDRRAVGLHFASAGGLSFCTPIQTVLNGLGVILAGP